MKKRLIIGALVLCMIFMSVIVQKNTSKMNFEDFLIEVMTYDGVKSVNLHYKEKSITIHLYMEEFNQEMANNIADKSFTLFEDDDLINDIKIYHDSESEGLLEKIIFAMGNRDNYVEWEGIIKPRSEKHKDSLIEWSNTYPFE